eukprot:7323523-Prymnesium_polylepis.1
MTSECWHSILSQQTMHSLDRPSGLRARRQEREIMWQPRQWAAKRKERCNERGIPAHRSFVSSLGE